jgi:hypothetical protein
MWYESVKQSAGGVNVVESGLGALVIVEAIGTEDSVRFHADETCVGAVPYILGAKVVP